MAVEEQEEQTEKEFDAELTESIGATLKEITSRPPTEEAATPKEEAAPVTLEVAPKDERARGPDGKFVEKPKEPAAPAKAEKAATTPLAQAAPEQAAAVPESPILTTTGQPIDINRAPSSWKPAAKAVWAGLPEPIRAEIHRRESDFLHGGKTQQVDADFGRTVKATVEPYRMLIEAEGGTPEKAIADTMKTAALFRVGQPQQKLDALFQIDQQFCGGALNKLFQTKLQEEVAKATGQPGEKPAATPQVFQDPRVDQLLASQQKLERERVEHETRISNAATERFLSAKDEKGQPLYPFVDNVLDDMSARVSSIRRQNPAIGHEEALKQAYEAAVWANPETRDVLLKQQQAQATASADTLRTVEQAKRASAGNMPKRGSIPAMAPNAKWGTPEADEEIRATYRQLTS